MGVGCSKVKHVFEDKLDWGAQNNEMYDKDPEDHYNQLNTDRDQRGETTVNHVYKKSRDVFGQPAVDIQLNSVNWSEYGIEFRTRPSPYDFPAFEHLKEDNPRLSIERAKVRTVKEKIVGNKEKILISEVPQSKNGKSPQDKKVDPISGVAKTSGDSGDDKKKPEKSRTNDKKQEKSNNGKDGKRLSHNAEMDHCSLEEN